MTISTLLFSILQSTMTERLFCADFFSSQHPYCWGLQHPYAGYRDVQKHLPGYPSTFAFCSGLQKVGIATFWRCDETKVCLRGRQDTCCNPISLWGGNNSDNQKRCHFIIVAKRCAILTDLWGRFESSISHTVCITIVIYIVHFPVSEIFHTWESLQLCD